MNGPNYFFSEVMRSLWDNVSEVSVQQSCANLTPSRDRQTSKEAGAGGGCRVAAAAVAIAIPPSIGREHGDLGTFCTFQITGASLVGNFIDCIRGLQHMTSTLLGFFTPSPLCRQNLCTC